MLLNYEIISNLKVDYGKSYIDYKRKRLIIKGIVLPDKQYYMLLKKSRLFSDGDGIYIALSNNKLNEACRTIIRSNFGYYSTDISEVLHEFNIRKDTNVILTLEEKDDEIIVYEINI